LSTTTNYFAPAGANPLSGARIVISDNAGSIDTLHEMTPGTYQTHTIQGVMGRTYYLNILANGKAYTASAFMPDTVSIDSVSYSLRQPRPGSGGSPSYSVRVSFTDPPTLGNYYGLRLWRNGNLLNNISDNRVIEDHLINGNAQHPRVGNSSLILNDSIQVDLVCFDKTAYDYYSTLSATLSAGGPFSAPPSNPTSNLSNGALGYFGVFSFCSRKLLLQ
ncbi:MAG TPA: DUF4249 domain-containing protein, partial [Bacteroidia bacterium]|nr:DUF4249 domain-containing protein [Bacteroidia bacterium]